MEVGKKGQGAEHSLIIDILVPTCGFPFPVFLYLPVQLNLIIYFINDLDFFLFYFILPAFCFKREHQRLHVSTHLVNWQFTVSCKNSVSNYLPLISYYGSEPDLI